jgi:succinate dehydrogenase / fumarate reductase flavoprotein subunit
MRDDENFAHASAWEFKGVDQPAVKYREELEFDVIKLTQRSYQ